MGRSKESFGKKEVRTKREKKRKEKEKKRLAKKVTEKKGSLDEMIAYVDENGMITSAPPDPAKKKDVRLEDIKIGIPSRANEEKPDPIRKGTVSFFNDSKGFGFIKDSLTQESVFFHVNNTLEEVKEGNLVSFEVEKGPKGAAATKVQVIRKP
jgi:cold shock CspA family protein